MATNILYKTRFNRPTINIWINNNYWIEKESQDETVKRREKFTTFFRKYPVLLPKIFKNSLSDELQLHSFLHFWIVHREDNLNIWDLQDKSGGADQYSGWISFKCSTSERCYFRIFFFLTHSYTLHGLKTKSPKNGRH